jgi:uncharacterized protein DUF4411
VPNRLYVIDTCALVEAWNTLYTPRSFANVWEWMDEHIERELLVSHHEVLLEINWPDALQDWAKDRKQIFTDSEAQEQRLCAELLTTYPDFRAGGGKTKWADPWVVARAKAMGGIVVSQEKPGSYKRIPYVCDQEGIECVTVQEMVNILGTRPAQ